MIKKITLLLFLIVGDVDAITYGKSFFLPRVQGGTAVEVLGWNRKINRYDGHNSSVVFKVQSEWYRSFNFDEVTTYHFFNGTKKMIFGGQQTSSSHQSTDVHALNFLLPDGFQSEVTSWARASDIVTDFSWYFGLDKFLYGGFISLHVPVAYRHWNVHLRESIVQK